MSNAPYDKVDAAYIFIGLHASYTNAANEEESDNGPIAQLIEHHSGECHLMAFMFETSIAASKAISSIVDFDRADLGMFAYDHLDNAEPGSLIYALWSACVLEQKDPAGVVKAWVDAMGWPTIVKGREVVQVVDSPVVSIQIQTVQIQPRDQTGDDAQVVASTSPNATHWSVYTRSTEGRAQWVADFAVLPGDTGQARTAAQMLADKLAAQYGVFIEAIK
jgi:hypothetical protein